MTAHVDPIPQEARVFQGRRAGLVTRAAAACIDIGVVVIALVVAYLGFVVVVFLVPPGGFEMPVPPLWLRPCRGGTVVMTLYLAVSWHRGGRTYGCHVMGLRVVDRRGGDPSRVTALLRAAFNVAFPVGPRVGCPRPAESIHPGRRTPGTSVIYDWDVRPEGVRRLSRRCQGTIQPAEAARATEQLPDQLG